MRQTKAQKTQAETRARFAEVAKRLAAQYPGAECALEWRTDAPDPADDGWRLLIMGRLSAQCTDARVNIVCRELLGLATTKDEPTPSERTQEYYKRRPCAEYVEIAARIVGEKINSME